MSGRPMRGVMSVMALAVLAAGGCLDLNTILGIDTIDVAVGIQGIPVADRTERPGAVVAASDGRVFFSERETGRIRVIEDGRLLDTPFATVPVNTAGDRGLLGLALHPNFADNGRVYAFYTRSSTGVNTSDAALATDHRVVYFNSSGNTATGSEVFVASIPVAGDGRRVGGRLAFGLDGNLYVAIGDQGVSTAAADPASQSGKILRYAQDGTIPATNPDPASPIFARGLRHPLGLASDALGGSLFALDRNEGGLHEVNRVLPGRDYGWPAVSGLANSASDIAYRDANPAYADPLLEAPVGSPAYVGLGINPAAKYGPATGTALFYGVSTARTVSAANFSAARDALSSANQFAANFPDEIVDLAFSPAGTLYVATSQAIYRLDLFAD